MTGDRIYNLIHHGMVKCAGIIQDRHLFLAMTGIIFALVPSTPEIRYPWKHAVPKGGSPYTSAYKDPSDHPLRKTAYSTG